jgi:hypothetical protein
MSTQELQLSLIAQILQTVDENVLKLLHETLQKTLSKSKSKTKKKLSIHDPKHPYYAKLTPEEEKGVAESLKDYAEGRYTTLRTKEEIRNHFINLVK